MISVSAVSMCPLTAKLLCPADQEFYLGHKGHHDLSRLACQAHATEQSASTAEMVSGISFCSFALGSLCRIDSAS